MNYQRHLPYLLNSVLLGVLAAVRRRLRELNEEARTLPQRGRLRSAATGRSLSVVTMVLTGQVEFKRLIRPGAIDWSVATQPGGQIYALTHTCYSTVSGPAVKSRSSLASSPMCSSWQAQAHRVFSCRNVLRARELLERLSTLVLLTWLGLCGLRIDRLQLGFDSHEKSGEQVIEQTGLPQALLLAALGKSARSSMISNCWSPQMVKSFLRISETGTLRSPVCRSPYCKKTPTNNSECRMSATSVPPMRSSAIRTSLPPEILGARYGP